MQLQQYRSIDAATFELHPRLTILLGPNGGGKTNTLEAISLLSVPRSFRGSRDRDLITWNGEFARISGVVKHQNNVERELVVFINGGKQLQVDGQPQTASEFIGNFLAVLFAPEDVELLAGPPSQRRSFLDAHLSLLSPAYLHHLMHYSQVVSRRNRLLSRQLWPGQDDMEYWDTQLLEHGTAIIEARLAAIDEFNAVLPASLQLIYNSSVVVDDEPVAETFHKKQVSLFERERQAGHTLVGPHRDDWSLQFADLGMSVGRYGSRGQQRMGVIALKQAQLPLISADKGETAVLLLDDVLSELDASHQQQLLSSIGQQQTILTSASLSDIPQALLDDVAIYEVSGGSWTRK